MKPITTAFFAERGFTPTAEHNCPDCIRLETSGPEDATGHRLRTVRQIAKKYVVNRPQDRRFGVWIAHSQPVVTADLRLTSQAGSCWVSLLFDHTWYSAEMMVVLPVDGDSESRPSNLRLEREYLDQIGARVKPAP